LIAGVRETGGDPDDLAGRIRGLRNGRIDFRLRSIAHGRAEAFGSRRKGRRLSDARPAPVDNDGVILIGESRAVST
jgi:hypothetical protein